MCPLTLPFRRSARAAVVAASVAAACTRTSPAPAASSTTASAGAVAPSPVSPESVAAPVPPAPSGATTSPPLDGTRWVLVRVGDQRVITPTADPRRVPHLVFDAGAGRVSGSGGCNRLAGPYRRQGDTLTVGPVVGTRMACPDVMATENALTGALERVRGWRVVEGRLELLSAPGPTGEVVAAFTPAPAAAGAR